jgi:hypothetical protein
MKGNSAAALAAQDAIRLITYMRGFTCYLLVRDQRNLEIGLRAQGLSIDGVIAALGKVARGDDDDV